MVTHAQPNSQSCYPELSLRPSQNIRMAFDQETRNRTTLHHTDQEIRKDNPNDSRNTSRPTGQSSNQTNRCTHTDPTGHTKPIKRKPSSYRCGNKELFQI